MNPSSKIWIIRFLPLRLWFIGPLASEAKVAGDCAEGHFSREMVQGFHQILRVSTPALLSKCVKVPAPRLSQTKYVPGKGLLRDRPPSLGTKSTAVNQGHGLIFFHSPGSVDPGDHAFSTPLSPFCSHDPEALWFSPGVSGHLPISVPVGSSSLPICT